MEFEHPFMWFAWEMGQGFWFAALLHWPIWLMKAGRWSSFWMDGK